MTSKRKTSEVWTYFSVDQDTPVFAQCLLCDMRFKRGKQNDRVSWSVSPFETLVKYAPQLLKCWWTPLQLMTTTKKNYNIFKKNLCPDPVSGPVRSGQPDRESRSGPVRSGFENPDPVGSYNDVLTSERSVSLVKPLLCLVVLV